VFGCDCWTTERLEFESRCGQEFSFLNIVQTGSSVHQNLYLMGTGGSFPGVKRPERDADHSTSNWCKSQEIVGLYIHSSVRLHGILLS
jgi:hypothetical protein